MHEPSDPHLTTCRRCRRVYDHIQHALSAVNEHADALTSPLEQRLPLILRLQREERAARQLFEGVDSREILAAADKAAERPEFWTASVLRRVTRAIDCHYAAWTPLETLRITNVAVLIAESGPLPLPLRAAAWREHGLALCSIGRFVDARSSIETSIDLARECGRVLDIARGVFSLATLCRDMDLDIEAMTHLQRARAMFETLGDTPRVTDVRAHEAAILHKAGRYAEALVAFEELAAGGERRGDIAVVAMQYGNIGICHIRMGSYPAGRDHLTKALAMYRSLGRPRDTARILRSLARLEIRETGLRGLDRMDEARRAYEKLSMAGEAIRTELVAIEELRNISDTEQLIAMRAATIVTAARVLGFDTAAVTALSALRDMAVRDITPEFLDDVASHINPAFVGRMLDMRTTPAPN